MESVDKTVSVVMCTYNGEKFLREQLDSIVKQTYPLHELIVQDDGSSDGTMAILEEYAERYPYMQVYRNESPKGINGNFISSIRRATGDFIAISDQDDIWEPYKIELQIQTIGSCLLSSGITKPFTTNPDVAIHFDGRVPNYGVERVMFVGSLPGHTMLFRREFLSIIPEIDHWLEFFMYDHLFQIVASAYGSVSFCDRILVNQRRHLNAATYGKPVDTQKTWKNAFVVVRRTFSNYWQLRSRIQTYFGRVYALLSTLSDAKEKEYAQQLAFYKSSSGLVAYIRQTLLCLKLRNKIFYSIETNAFVSILRAIYFPISCSDYFRYMIKD